MLAWTRCLTNPMLSLQIRDLGFVQESIAQSKLEYQVPSVDQLPRLGWNIRYSHHKLSVFRSSQTLSC